MTNRNLFLLLGTSLSLVPQALSAQCVSPIQDCYALGYTQSSCPNGKGVKCPFGNGWYCGGTAAQDCIKLGYDKDCTGAGERGSGETCNGKYQSCTCDSIYKYTCSGTGYSGGSGTACGGKYTQCTCASPYTWSGSACTCPSTYKYTCFGTGYSGGSGKVCGGKYTKCTCASGYEWNGSSCQKQILNGAQGELYYCNGTVVGVKASGMNFYIALKDIPYTNWTESNNQCSSYSFCNNIKGILPSKEQLITIYNNKSQINSLLAANNGTKLTEGWYWSSTNVISNKYYYVVNLSNGSEDYGVYYNYNGANARPVLTSW